ncbi:MAG TPA: tRNA (guanosine(18)-2'-O)-methyltransferase TrmH [Thermoanaerobaculia bacterium]|nr:tRNA (guanosine(18)-2'-O)-methyltransferase TrmH [Thermoanaerobaculia bacterium]
MSAERIARLRATLDRRQPDLTVVLEGVHKPHNLAAVLRSCDAVGVWQAHAVTREARTRWQVSSAVGAAKWVEVEVWEEVGAVLGSLRERGFQIWAAHLDEGARDFRSLDYTGPTAFLLGQEKLGVTAEALAAVDGSVAIPMVGLVTSLNVSVAAALLLFEAQRQRSGAGLYDAPRLPEEARTRRLFEWAWPELAAYCRRHGLPYPRLDENGDLAEPLPR